MFLSNLFFGMPQNITEIFICVSLFVVLKLLLGSIQVFKVK